MLSFREKRILFIEDSEEDYLIANRAFKINKLDHYIFRVNTGDKGLDYLLNKGEFTDLDKYYKPELIILDLNLPGMDGRELLKLIKQSSGLKKIPVVIFTTSGDLQDIENCYLEGANTYLKKPIDFSGFVDSVKSLKNYWFGVAVLPEVIL